jgi:hypothetical protein
MSTVRNIWLGLLASVAAMTVANAPAAAQQKKPNIVMLMTDDTAGTISGPMAGA